METFPDWLNPTETENIRGKNVERIAGLLRKAICEHISQRPSEEDYFDVESFRTGTQTGMKRDDFYKLLNPVAKELRELGWKTKMSFGNTGLFVYSTEEPPSTCW